MNNYYLVDDIKGDPMGRECGKYRRKDENCNIFPKLNDQTSRNKQISTLIVNRIGDEEIRCGDVNRILVSGRVKLQIP